MTKPNYVPKAGKAIDDDDDEPADQQRRESRGPPRRTVRLGHGRAIDGSLTVICKLRV